jgi:hypothetical protein
MGRWLLGAGSLAASGAGCGFSDPFGCADRTRVSCGAWGLNRVGGRPSVGGQTWERARPVCISFGSRPGRAIKSAGGVGDPASLRLLWGSPGREVLS